MSDHTDPQLKQYYETYLDLFAHPGWKLFMEELQGHLEHSQATAVGRCDTTEKWFQERGDQARTSIILGFETAMRTQWDNMQNPATAEEE